jgi:hypothetical protein
MRARFAVHVDQVVKTIPVVFREGVAEARPQDSQIEKVGSDVLLWHGYVDEMDIRAGRTRSYPD